MNLEQEGKTSSIKSFAASGLRRGRDVAKNTWKRTKTPLIIAGVGATAALASERFLVTEVRGDVQEKVTGTLVDAKLLEPVKITLPDGTVVEQDPAVKGFIKVCVSNKHLDTKKGERVNNDQCSIQEGYLKPETANMVIEGGPVSEDSDYFFGARHTTITSGN